MTKISLVYLISFLTCDFITTEWILLVKEGIWMLVKENENVETFEKDV